MSQGLLKLLERQRSGRDLGGLAAWLDGKGEAREAGKITDLALDVAAARKAADGGTTADVLDVVRHEIGAGGLDASASALDGWSHGAVAAHGDDLDALASLASLEPDPGRFGGWLADALATAGDDDGVTLASIHAVKGQEWPHVVVHHVSDGVLPHRLVEDEEEERRVLHVGLTRGRRTVTLVPGTVPSPFLAELAAPGTPAPPRARPPARPVPVVKAPTVAVELDSAGEAAFARLRAWRTERAAGKPAYTVFGDETLRLVAASLPATEAELRRIKGIGPTKLELYGEDLLALTSELRTAPA